jgi:hypothetical protein
VPNARTRCSCALVEWALTDEAQEVHLEAIARESFY